MSDAETPADDDATDDEQPATVTVAVRLDVPREMMFDELAEQFGDDKLRKVLGRNVEDAAQSVITQLYDNRDRISEVEQAEGDPQP